MRVFASHEGAQPKRYIDVALAKPSPVRTMTLQNSYAAFVTIKLRGQARADGPWATVAHFLPLMRDPHSEEDAEEWKVIQLPAVPGVEKVAKLRLYLMQPSPVWDPDAVGVSHVRCFASADTAACSEASACESVSQRSCG